MVLIRLVVGLLFTAAQASPLAHGVDYTNEIKPIFHGRCTSCHGGLKQEAELRLDTGALIRSGGQGGPAVASEHGSASLLLERITESDESLRMPPEGDPLTADQILLIKAWINEGANSPADELPEEDARLHWAFQRPARPAVPAVKNADWVRNPIDAFVAAQRDSRGLKPLAAAEKHILLRRLFLDLIGLPPSPAEIHAFVNDASPSAYEDVVDALLARPEYGERWGRHWMDVWRYSDWYGRRRVPDCLRSYGQIWRWRDWIVRSLNEDKGYDRMILEMLAADEISPADDQNVVATGFVVRNFYRWNYNIWMKDAVEHTGKAFLGLTLNCCHCHDHKYDPIDNEEYFRFRAFFEPVEIRHDRVPGEPDPGEYPKYVYGSSYKPITSGMVRIMDAKLDAETYVYTDGEARNVTPGSAPVSPGAPVVLGGDELSIEAVSLPATAWYPGLKSFVREEMLAAAEAKAASATKALADARDVVANEAGETNFDGNENDSIANLTRQAAEADFELASAELRAVRRRLEADAIRYLEQAGDADEAARQASYSERQAALAKAMVEVAQARLALAQARRDANPSNKTEEQIAQREEKVQSAEKQLADAQTAVRAAEENLEVPSTEYTALSPKYPQQSTGRRTALARWIANSSNPLTARVAVNHIWLRHFGRAIVETTADFGRRGAKPTHPDLLDWLAVELMEQNWRMKPIHRLLVTSNTYRMRSIERRTEGNLTDGEQTFLNQLSVDPDNVYLWRSNPRRMEAEVIRDSILAVSGSLDLTMGGQEIDQNEGLTSPRRSIYFEHHGEGCMQLLDLFDGANPCDAYKRTSSVRPQQALAMANSTLSLREGRRLARRLSAELAAKEDGIVSTEVSSRFVEVAFQRVLNRPPTTEECAASREFMQEQEQLFIDSPIDEAILEGTDKADQLSSDPKLRARESFVQALFSHHDFVTIR